MKYKKKPIVIEALQFLDNSNALSKLSDFMGREIKVSYKHPKNPVLVIDALEGPHTASVGDYIIKGVKNEFYPCKPDIFEQIYEQVGD